MHALRFCLIGLMATAPGFAYAQLKSAPKSAERLETRYFTSVDGMMDGNADVILKETRQGKTVTAATLDVCYPADRGSARKDRFVTTLAINGTMMTGTATSEADRLPVSVKLNRKPTGETFEFKGQITVGQTTTDVTSADNTDLSEAEFRDSQSSDDAHRGRAERLHRSVAGIHRGEGQARRRIGFSALADAARASRSRCRASPSPVTHCAPASRRSILPSIPTGPQPLSPRRKPRRA